MNQAGQLGQGDTERRGGANGGVFEMGDNLPPVDVVGVNGAAAGLEVESISLGGSSACAVITGGLLKVRACVWGWGRGYRDVGKNRTCYCSSWYCSSWCCRRCWWWCHSLLRLKITRTSCADRLYPVHAAVRVRYSRRWGGVDGGVGSRRMGGRFEGGEKEKQRGE